MPKTAGTSFGRVLAEYFGERLFLDYGDRIGWTGVEADAWRRYRTIPEKVLSGSVAIVHGHFYLEKYIRLFPDAVTVAFVREPVSRVISNYRFLAVNPQIDHPLVAEFHGASPTLLEWAAWPWARNVQSMLLGGRGIEDMDFVGITERYDESLKQFDALVNSNLAGVETGDIHNQAEGTLNVSEADRGKIAALNRADMCLYARASNIFEAKERG